MGCRHPDPWGWRGHLREPASGPAALPTFRPQVQEVGRGERMRPAGGWWPGKMNNDTSEARPLLGNTLEN